MSPLSCRVMGSENYDDWSWFLQILNKVIGKKEVFIILDRHSGLLRSVPKIFGAKNYAYCYRHLKKNFSSYFNKHSTKGNKGKENFLEWLDKIEWLPMHKGERKEKHVLIFFTTILIH